MYFILILWSSHNALSFLHQKRWRRYFEFKTELLWVSLHFWQPNAFTLPSMDRNACHVYLNSLGINWITRLCILWLGIATQQAKSWICGFHQPRISLSTFWRKRQDKKLKRIKTGKNIAENWWGKWLLCGYYALFDVKQSWSQSIPATENWFYKLVPYFLSFWSVFLGRCVTYTIG